MVRPGGTFDLMEPDIPRSVSRYMAEIGRKGGRRKTDAKAAASAENGKKGGRPRAKNGGKPS